jgi:hypothetical protein
MDNTFAFHSLITSIFYLILRGKGMAKRQRAYRLDTNAATLCKSPAEQIWDAKKLLEQGVINQEEFETLKKKPLIKLNWLRGVKICLSQLYLVN